jgi:hypothetical protein
MNQKCPGINTRNWKPSDISEITCSKCGNVLEFFKDDIKRECSCGYKVLNPKFNTSCLSWCQYADKCTIGKEE